MYKRQGLHLARVLYDDGVRVRMSPSLAALMPEARVYVHPRDAGSLGLTEGAIAEVAAGDSIVELPIAFDPSLAVGTVYVPANLPETAGLSATPGVTVTRRSEDGA